MGCTGEEARRWLMFSRCWFCLPLRTGIFIVASLESILLLAGLGVFIQIKVTGLAREFIDKIICDVILNIMMTLLLIVGVVKGKRELVHGWLWLRVPLLVTDLGLVALQSAIVRSGTVFFVSFALCLFVIHNLVLVLSYAMQMPAGKSPVPDGPAAVPSYAKLEDECP